METSSIAFCMFVCLVVCLFSYLLESCLFTCLFALLLVSQSPLFLLVWSFCVDATTILGFV